MRQMGHYKKGVSFFIFTEPWAAGTTDEFKK